MPTRGSRTGGKRTSRRQSKTLVDNFEQNKAPFQETWINECYEKLIFPNQNSVEVMEKVNRMLPRHVVKAQTSDQKQQALFLLLGEQFTEQHFPKQKMRREILEPPKMNAEMKEKYFKDMKEFLKEALNKSLEDCGYPSDFSKPHTKEDEMSKYIQEIRYSYRDAFTTNVTLDAFNTEAKKLLKEKEDDKNSAKKQSNDDDSDYSDVENKTNNGLSQDIGVTYTYEGDSSGKAFLAFMAHDNTKEPYYKKLIRSKLMALPLSLRQHYWHKFFIRKEISRLKLKPGDNFKKAMERDFDVNLKEQMKKKKIRRSAKGPNSKAIDSHIIETYGGSYSLEEIDTDNMMITAAVAVNMSDIVSDSYTPINSLLVIPLMAAYPIKDKEDEDDYVQYIAMHLNLAIKYCKLSPSEIFRLSAEVFNIVKEEDPEYLDHISKCLSTQTNKSNPLDFTPEVFLEDTTAGTKIFNNLVSKGRKEAHNIQERYQEQLSDLTLYIRKWIGQVFVGILSLNTMMWAWDQLFLNEWSRDTVKHIALGILALIKPWMYRAQMYSGARKVLIEEPTKLYTSDLRNAVAHLENGGLFTQIPTTKNFLEVKESAARKKSEAKEEKRPPRIAVPVEAFNDHPEFILDIDLTMDNFDDYEPEPIEAPRPDDPDTDSDDDDDIRQRDPNEPDTPPDTPPPMPTKTNWIEKDSDPFIPVKPVRINEPFDLYVDYIRFLPDQITVCKVIGRIMNTGLPKGTVKDVVAYPILESYRRSPSFKLKLTVDPGNEKINNNATIVFKIFGYETSSNDIVVVGSCLLGLYSLINNKFMLKSGGHQLRLRHGGPNPSGGIVNLHESDMNHNSLIPGTSLCVRLLQSSKIYDPTPNYEDAYYESNSAKPNTTEERLFEHYTNMDDYTTLRICDVLKILMRERREKTAKDDKEMQKFMERIMNHVAAQNRIKSAIPDLDYAHYVTYDQKQGANVCVQGAFGMPESMEDFYTHALGEYLPGKDTKSYVSSSDLDDFRVITRRLDLVSPRRSPDWLDLKTTIRPPYDANGVFVVRVYGIRPNYIPTKDDDEDGEEEDFLEGLKGALDGEVDDEDDADNDSSKGGVVLPRDRDAFFIDYEEPLFWGVMQMFSNGCAFGGLHSIPLFSGTPPQSLLEECTTSPVAKVLTLWSNNDYIIPETKSLIEVEIWDGHVESEDIPEPSSDKLLDLLGIRSTANESRSKEYRAKFSDFVFENMSKTGQNKGTTSSKYVRESYIFQKEANRQLIISLNAALRYAGKKELSYS